MDKGEQPTPKTSQINSETLPLIPQITEDDAAKILGVDHVLGKQTLERIQQALGQFFGVEVTFTFDSQIPFPPEVLEDAKKRGATLAYYPKVMEVQDEPKWRGIRRLPITIYNLLDISPEGFQMTPPYNANKMPFRVDWTASRDITREELAKNPKPDQYPSGWMIEGSTAPPPTWRWDQASQAVTQLNEPLNNDPNPNLRNYPFRLPTATEAVFQMIRSRLLDPKSKPVSVWNSTILEKPQDPIRSIQPVYVGYSRYGLQVYALRTQASGMTYPMRSPK